MAVKTGPNTPPKNKFREPRLIIPNDVYRKIMFWVDQSDFECSWLGTIDHDVPSNTFYVVDVFLLEQENGAASTDLDQNEITKLLYEQRDNPFDIKWWGHSHVKMEVFWSGTDIATMEILSDGGWFISTVFNQYRKMKTAFTQLSPLPVMIDSIETVVHDFLSEQERKEWKEEYDAKVKKRVYQVTMPKTLYSGGNKVTYYSGGNAPTPKNNIPEPANMPDWKQYATDKWKEGLHASEAIACIDNAKNSQELILESDAAPSDPFEDLNMYRAAKKEESGDDLGEREFSPQEEEFLEELWSQYYEAKAAE